METMTEHLKAPWRVVACGVVDRDDEIVLEHEEPVRTFRLAAAVNLATADERGETPFVVWSNEHRGWWGPGRCGYVFDLRDAGIYSRAEAEDICERQESETAVAAATGPR
jgi:hypothetical protein